MSDETRQRLAQLSSRLERMALEPESIEAPWTVRLARPFYRWAGWQPKLRADACHALLKELTKQTSDEERRDSRFVPEQATDEQATEEQATDEQATAEPLSDAPDAALLALSQAIDELEQNVRLAERATMINGRLTLSQHAWLSRMAKVLGQAVDVIEGDAGASVAAAALDPVFIAPPLRVAAQDEDAAEVRRQPQAEGGPAQLLEMQLAAIDHIIEAARAEEAFLERRRRLLEAARRLLLDADAALRLDAQGVRLRKQYLTSQIVHLDRIQAAGVSPHVSLLHQAKSAYARGQHARLYATLVAMEGFAVAAADPRMAQLASGAMRQLEMHAQPASREHSQARSVGEIFGEDVLDTIAQARSAAHVQLMQKSAALSSAADAASNGTTQGGTASGGASSDGTSSDGETFELALEYLAPATEPATMSALLSVDGCFDVGAPLAPVRILEHETVAQVVPYPTQELIITPARGPKDIASATISDPRSIVLDLAAGRLLSRKFVRYEERERERIKMVGEVRFYLLDGSTSMMTNGAQSARARMRDAILTAELATLLRRLRYPDRDTRVVLYYRYFTKRIWALSRVASAEEALAAIGDVVSRQRTGGTDIEQALSSCFETIRDAAAEDPELARAQVVLITDGKAEVTEQMLVEARGQIGQLPVNVSVIALGQENETLRLLVAQQRARGERSFYHFIDDDTLAALCSGQWGAAQALHLLDVEEAPPLSRQELTDAIAAVLDEASELEQARHRVLLTPPADVAAALQEVGLPPEMLSEGQRARHEAAERDRRAVEQRYQRWFPQPPSIAGEESADATSDEAMAAEEAAAEASAEHEAAVLVLSTVAEVISELSGEPLMRKADAIDVLERLLPDAQLAPGQYRALVSQPTPRVAQALQAVNALTDG